MPPDQPKAPWKRAPFAKRLFDLVLTIPGLMIISPVLAVIAVLVRIQMGRPVLFGQLRGGLGGSVFKIYKFRSMRDANGPDGSPLPDAERLTRLGAILRATSLDELPELFCVLRGEMSLVGPRPLMAKYLQRYSPDQARRHNVLPGITGWAQINGRNALSWEDKFSLDVWYVDHWSFWLDVRILAMTFWKAVRREGISEPGEATAREFLGTQKEGGT
jgi:sugar transferase EpsL